MGISDGDLRPELYFPTREVSQPVVPDCGSELADVGGKSNKYYPGTGGSEWGLAENFGHKQYIWLQLALSSPTDNEVSFDLSGCCRIHQKSPV
jgi:hypothetical protein